MRVLITAALLASAMHPCAAGFYTGNEIHESCMKSRLFVMGYTAGAFDALEKGQAAASAVFLSGLDEKLNPPNQGFFDRYVKNTAVLGSYCAPKGIVLSQVTDIFCNYLESNPATRHEPADTLLARALSQAWPCKAMNPQ